MNKLVMVKLGGSLITNKSKPMTLREEVLEDVVGQIKQAWPQLAGRLVVGHGSGSFAHVPAEKYRTIEGKINDESRYGFCVVEDSASKLNRLVVDELLKQGVPAVSMRMSNMLVVGKAGQESRFFREGLDVVLEQGLLPVFFGDPVFGGEHEFTIWSTEKILDFLCREMVNTGVGVEQIIHCGEVEGFLENGKVVPVINSDNLEEMKQKVEVTRGFDVTGGMLHKLEEAMESARLGVKTSIIGGLVPNNLFNALLGKEFVGTRIEA